MIKTGACPRGSAGSASRFKADRGIKITAHSQLKNNSSYSRAKFNLWIPPLNALSLPNLELPSI